jgi:hypothetical protein
MVKAMIARVLEEHIILQQGILHRIELLDKKFEVVCQTMFGIKIVVSQVIEEDKVPRSKEGP